MKVSRYVIAGEVNWALLTVIAVVLLTGLIAMQVSGFEFAPDAANLFLTKLPVLFLVALLIERTAEIFLTISRGGKSVNMEAKLITLTDLNDAKTKRDASLTELSGKIAACDKSITGLTAVTGKEADLKVQQDQKAALLKEQVELESAKAKEDAQITALEGATIDNGKPATLENRTRELGPVDIRC